MLIPLLKKIPSFLTQSDLLKVLPYQSFAFCLSGNQKVLDSQLSQVSGTE
jgi:hypothetical protein